MVNVRTRQADATRPLRLAPRGEQPLRRAEEADRPRLRLRQLRTARQAPTHRLLHHALPAIGPSPPGSRQQRPSRVGKQSRWSSSPSRPAARRSSYSNTSGDFRHHATARWKAVEAIFRPYLDGDEPFPDRTHLNVLAGRLLLETARAPGRVGRPNHRGGSAVGHDRGTPGSRLDARRAGSRARRRSALNPFRVNGARSIHVGLAWASVRECPSIDESARLRILGRWARDRGCGAPFSASCSSAAGPFEMRARR